MPVPIRYIADKGRGESNPMDFSILLNFTPAPTPKKKKITASNKDAALLYELWDRAERTGEDTLNVNSLNGINSKDILRLKTRGFISGGSEEVKVTKKGKYVITVMALNEPSQFEAKRIEKGYNEILADMSKRGKPGYRIPKFATNNYNNLRLS